VELTGLRSYDIAGPICESTDYLARERELPPLTEGDLVCIFGAGAYGMAMASQYNSVPRPAEILVDADAVRTIRRRETYADLIEEELNL
jgi:diaminopimelate decarboxylase